MPATNRINYIRHAIVLVAWLAALRAFALLHALSACAETRNFRRTQPWRLPILNELMYLPPAATGGRPSTIPLRSCSA
jgi:hypothetical protein